MKHYQIMKGVHTRRHYLWQVHCMQDGLASRYALSHRSLADLELLANTVMTEKSKNREGWVWIYFHRGASSGCYGTREIWMVPRQYCYAVLLHELTHALGFPWHTSGFTQKYIDLLVEYAACSRGLLEISAGLYGVIK